MKSSILPQFFCVAVCSCAPIQSKTASHPKFTETHWDSVSKVTSGLTYDPLNRPSIHQNTVKTTAQQATLVTESLGINQRWWGYSGPENLHTRQLKFVCGGYTYSVPESFAGGLLDLHIDFPTHATLDGNNRVFSMKGCSGEKGYTVHFCFRLDRFQQRILEYTEENDIYIKQQPADGKSSEAPQLHH